MNTVNIRRLIAGLALGVAFAAPTLLPADAMAQGRSDHGGRHDNGNHDGRDDRRGNQDRRGDQNRDRDRRNDTSHRQTTKNNWRNLGIAGGALGVYGLLSGNKTLAALGIGGGLYSASRYEADRKSQNRDSRDRYSLFSRSSFDHQGHHYERRTRMVNGKKNYYFSRTR